jgi:hypothetical protein
MKNSRTAPSRRIGATQSKKPAVSTIAPMMRKTTATAATVHMIFFIPDTSPDLLPASLRGMSDYTSGAKACASKLPVNEPRWLRLPKRAVLLTELSGRFRSGDGYVYVRFP